MYFILFFFTTNTVAQHSMEKLKNPINNFDYMSNHIISISQNDKVNTTQHTYTRIENIRNIQKNTVYVYYECFNYSSVDVCKKKCTREFTEFHTCAKQGFVNITIFSYYRTFYYIDKSVEHYKVQDPMELGFFGLVLCFSYMLILLCVILRRN